MNELLNDVAQRASRYLEGIRERRAWPELQRSND